MLRTPPHPTISKPAADPSEQLLAAVCVALVAARTALHAAGLANQVCRLRPGLPAGPAAAREATP